MDHAPRLELRITCAKQYANSKERQSLEGVADQKETKQRQKGRAKAKRGF